MVIAIDFDKELAILKSIRDNFSPNEIELRVDANGAFSPDEAMGKLEQLAAFQLHSIEQPIKAGQWDNMALLCEKPPLPIALDEELIGVFDVTETGQIIVPIDNKLSITEAKAFAVTIEAPGGVVQSKRDRLPLLAGEI